MNKGQLKIINTIKEINKQRKPIRIIILKARQIGISTLSTAYLYHQSATHFYTSGMIIANDSNSSSNLFNMAKRFYDFSPEIIKPARKYSNARELVFQKDDGSGLNSKIVIESAQKTTAGRSGTFHNLVLSEFGFWENADITLTGLFQCVPNKPGTSVIIESTANGMGGKGKVFFEKWQSAVRKDSNFIPIFLPWFDFDDYELEVPNDFQLTKEEKDLVERFPQITPRKLMFRRFKISTEMGSALLDPVTQFKQEYPSSDAEAFITSGRSVFDSEKILNYIKSIESMKFERYEI